MAANLELQRVNEWASMRGFTNLFRKENRAWWGTRRWWIIALTWTILLCGLTGIILFGPNEEVNQATADELAQAGGLIAYILSLGLSVFFEFGSPMLAIGAIILAQDLILGEKQSGVVEWLLSKPVTRRAYIIAKIVANAIPILVLLVGLPCTVVYSMLSLRMGLQFPVAPFLFAVGFMSLHSLFYVTLTLMLGTIFNNRGAILGIALGSVLGGGILGGFIKPLFYITPWMLPKLSWLTTTSQMIPIEFGIAPLVATALWIVVFILVALWKFEKTEY